jgi:hypothetical protein
MIRPLLVSKSLRASFKDRVMFLLAAICFKNQLIFSMGIAFFISVVHTKSINYINRSLNP